MVAKAGDPCDNRYMIQSEEIAARAKEMGVHSAHVQRDYVFGWLLKGFYDNAFLRNILIFKGGNCMRKAYFEGTRFSTDLDFSIENAIDLDRLRIEVNAACSAAHDQCGVEFEIERNTIDEEHVIDAKRQSYKGRLYFKDFDGRSGEISISIRLDFTEFDKIILPTVERPLIHPYSDADICTASIRCMALEELLANKLKCLLQRRHSFDLYDFVYATFFDQTHSIDRSLVLSTFLRKTIFDRSPGAAKEILLGLPVAFFRGAWEKYVAPLAARMDFDKAFAAFRDGIESIFPDESYFARAFEPFYPANLRNLIFDAGMERKVMTITYDGIAREIEPYALAYKRTRQGVASEYFYAWDRTGGQSGQTGIKTFFHHKIQNLAVLEGTFEPRFPIELKKAGEVFGKSYFGQPFRGNPMRQPSRRTSSLSNRTQYTVECPYCQKQFKRVKRDTTLRPHNSPDGYRCNTRRGTLVW